MSMTNGSPMTPAPISVERLRELHAVAFQWPPRNLDKFADAMHEALPALLHQLAEMERELHDAEHEVTIMERNLIAAERAREEAERQLGLYRKAINQRGEVMNDVTESVELTGTAMMARLEAETGPTIGEVEIAEVIQNHTGCADSDSIYAALAILQALRPMRDELATLQVIHNCLRRDHERSKAQAKAAREMAEQWNADARAEGFGGGSVKGREIIEAMDAAFLAASGGKDG